MQAIRAALASGVLALTALLAGCGGGGDAADPDAPPSPSGTATVGTSGGTLTSDDGVRLTVPPGSLGETITLRVARDTTGLSAALQGGTPQPDKAVALSPVYAMTPHGTVFARPVELRIPIDTAAAAGPGLLVVLRTEPDRDGWDVMPVQKVENGQAVVNITTFSFYRVIKITGIVLTPNTLPVPPVLEMSMTLGGAGPSDFTWVHADGTAQRTGSQRRLHGTVANRSDTLRLSGRIVGLPASCSTISLAGAVMPTQNPTAADTSSNQWGVGRNNLGHPVFAEQAATVGSDTTGRVTRPTLSFAFDINADNAPYKVELFRALRASNTTGPTPPIGLNFNAYARCTSDVDLGDGLVLHNWMIVPGVTDYTMEGFNNAHFLDPHNWLWNTILFTTDYLPQGTVTPPQDVTAAVGMPASFSTSFWPAPEGESRIEWWRSDNAGGTWSRVRTTIVPIALSSDTYTIPATASSDNNALIRVRLCGIPRTVTPDESCTDTNPVRLTVLQGISAAGFSQQPRPVLVRTGQTATFSVAVSGTPTPSVRWQRRAANSSGAWADVSSGSGAATLNYTTTPLTAPDNGVQLRAVANNLLGDVASVPVTVSVSDIDVPPTVASQPAALSVVAGSEAVFAVVARGTEALSYQWRRNGAAINGANAPVLKLAQVTSADATGYSVLVSNTAGSVVSETAALTVSDGPVQPVAPSIVTQPVAVVVNAGNTATFAVGVSGSGPLSFQWLRNGAPIAGAVSAFHSIAQAGRGRCRRVLGAGEQRRRRRDECVGHADGECRLGRQRPRHLDPACHAGGRAGRLGHARGGRQRQRPARVRVAARRRTGDGPGRRGLSLRLGVGARRRCLPGAGEQRPGRGDERRRATARRRFAGRERTACQRQRGGRRQRDLQRRRDRRRAALPMAARQRGHQRRHRHELHHGPRAGRQRRALQRARLQQRGLLFSQAGHAHRHRADLDPGVGNAQGDRDRRHRRRAGAQPLRQRGGRGGGGLDAARRRRRHQHLGQSLHAGRRLGHRRAHLRWPGRRARRPGGGDRRERPRDRRLATGRPHLGQPLHPRQRLERAGEDRRRLRLGRQPADRHGRQRQRARGLVAKRGRSHQRRVRSLCGRRRMGQPRDARHRRHRRRLGAAGRRQCRRQRGGRVGLGGRQRRRQLRLQRLGDPLPAGHRLGQCGAPGHQQRAAAQSRTPTPR
jgi:hypothetical protein